MITQLITFMIMAYGFTNILVYGSIFNGPRNFIREKSLDEGSLIHHQWKFLIDMLSCMMCCSTWVGFFFGVVFYSPINQILGVTPWISWFFDGMLASGSVWAINSIIEWFEENRPNKKLKKWQNQKLEVGQLLTEKKSWLETKKSMDKEMQCRSYSKSQ